MTKGMLPFAPKKYQKPSETIMNPGRKPTRNEPIIGNIQPPKAEPGRN